MSVANLVATIYAVSAWEVTAALFGIAYVILAARESQWCWPLAFVSTLIYTVLFWEGLPMQALLNFYYMGMAIYGYSLWRTQGASEVDLAISSWAWQQQLLFLIIGTVLTIATAHYLIAIDVAQNPYLEAGVTVFSVMNTLLLAKKVIQNWWYWIVIDIASITLYAQNGYYATIVMYSIYLILAVVGYVNWRKLYHQQLT